MSILNSIQIGIDLATSVSIIGAAAAFIYNAKKESRERAENSERDRKKERIALVKGWLTKFVESCYEEVYDFQGVIIKVVSVGEEYYEVVKSGEGEKAKQLEIEYRKASNDLYDRARQLWEFLDLSYNRLAIGNEDDFDGYPEQTRQELLELKQEIKPIADSIDKMKKMLESEFVRRKSDVPLSQLSKSFQDEVRLLAAKWHAFQLS